MLDYNNIKSCYQFIMPKFCNSNKERSITWSSVAINNKAAMVHSTNLGHVFYNNYSSRLAYQVLCTVGSKE